MSWRVVGLKMCTLSFYNIFFLCVWPTSSYRSSCNASLKKKIWALPSHWLGCMKSPRTGKVESRFYGWWYSSFNRIGSGFEKRNFASLLLRPCTFWIVFKVCCAHCLTEKNPNPKEVHIFFENSNTTDVWGLVLFFFLGWLFFVCYVCFLVGFWWGLFWIFCLVFVGGLLCVFVAFFGGAVEFLFY